LLQPLLENAVKHGALRRREGGEVAVRTTLDPVRLTCVVEDNGPGPGDRRARTGALGLELVTRRLALKYAGAAVFRLEAHDGRTRSIVEIPREALR
jgi:LytS/YehU family sensor histidine kinase